MEIPARGVTELTFFHPHLLGIKLPSQLYFEGHASNYVNSRVKADRTVNAALDSTLARENNWSRKTSTIAKCDSIFTEISRTQFIPTELNTYNLACSTSVELPKIKETVKDVIANEYLSYFNDQINNLTMQGDFIKLLVEEEEDVTWKSIIYSVPKGVMSFACRAATNSLATNDNLVRWGKKTNSTCNLNVCLHKGRDPPTHS